MRDLDFINGAAKSTKHIFAISLTIPIFMGLGAWALATGAAPSLPLYDNYLEVFGLSISVCAILALPVPYIFRWNWEAKYFGAGLLPFACGSIIGIFPTLCIVLYGSPPLIVSVVLILAQCLLIARWCNRFVKVYGEIYRDKNLFSYIYAEEPTAVFYLQQADKKVVDNILKFQQFPSSKFFIISLFAAFSLIPFATSLSRFFGVPIIHIFLAVGAMPLNLMFLGLSTKMWLVYYFYPIKIKKETKKPVYVDTSSQPEKSLRRHRIRKYDE